MDSRSPPPQPPPPQSTIMVGPTSYAPTNTSMISPNSSTTNATNLMAPATARFPFSSSQQSEPFSVTHDNNAPPSSPSTLAKKKRGRPRKYSPDGNIALGLAPTHVSSPAAATSASAGDSGNADAPPKKHRGRPPGSGKKQLDALGAGGTGFTPHVIVVESGEDITEKVMSFLQIGPRTVVILSAVGAISNVTLRQPTLSGGVARFEGQFEIISLSGDMQLSENNGEQSRTSSLYVSLAGADGRVLGGAVAGMLTAASAVQVIVGSFIMDQKKSSSSMVKSGPSSAPTSQMLNFGAPTTPTSPTSQGPSTESSEENDHNSNFSRGPGIYNNANQPVHNNMQQMYHHPLWAGQSHQ
ncbi:hypothetical protein P8452_76303 [Trifolium repens]|nr:AT-hook motif nuclear-localized protein [Trifolium repens]WJX94932.1 hypothetical protein P8452_76303 [Trifolium repens]